MVLFDPLKLLIQSVVVLALRKLFDLIGAILEVYIATVEKIDLNNTKFTSSSQLAY